MSYIPTRRDIMLVRVNGVECEREVVGTTNTWNGYKNVQVPMVENGESLYWTAGNRVPHIEGFTHA